MNALALAVVFISWRCTHPTIWELAKAEVALMQAVRSLK